MKNRDICRFFHLYFHPFEILFHLPAMYTLLQIHFYSHKVQFLSVDYLLHSSIHVSCNIHTSASTLNPDVSNLQFLNQLIQSISECNYKRQDLFENGVHQM